MSIKESEQVILVEYDDNFVDANDKVLYDGIVELVKQAGRLNDTQYYIKLDLQEKTGQDFDIEIGRDKWGKVTFHLNPSLYDVTCLPTWSQCIGSYVNRNYKMPLQDALFYAARLLFTVREWT